MGARLGRRIWAQRGWDYLRKLGHSLQTPRPRNVKAASAEEQELYKKALLALVVGMQTAGRLLPAE
jgi:hypothetical protein